MLISKDKVVSLSYELKVKGEVVDKAEALNPLTFLYGHGNLLPLFEDKINGLTPGENFEFMIPCNEGYGLVNEDAIVQLPKDIFIVDGELASDLLEVGRTLPMRDNEGHAMNGTIIEIADDHVTMDFNHPLAGEDLFFKGKIESIRDASEEELEHGHVHNHGHHHDHAGDDHACGCGCN